MKSQVNNLIDKFEKKSRQYENLSNKMNILLKELLDQEEISYHSIVDRVKDKESLSKKIDAKNKYKDLDEITDIVGCRIISYFEDDVERIVEIIGKEFKVDKKNSIDKKKMLDPDKFGYVSYHIVCSINNEREKLREYKNYKDIKFEIQIRTILQHAWAEIEHDIGYKTNISVPRDFRRKFSRIAGMLEIADDEFSRLKHDINNYIEDISHNKEIENTDINAESLKIFLEKSKDIKEIEKYISEELNTELNEYTEKEQWNAINWTLPLINELTEYQKIIDIKSSIADNKEIIKRFLVRWVNTREELYNRFKNNEVLKVGLVIGYAIIILLLKNNDKNGLENFIARTKNSKDEDLEQDIEMAFKVYKEIVEEL